MALDDGFGTLFAGKKLVHGCYFYAAAGLLHLARFTRRISSFFPKGWYFFSAKMLIEVSGGIQKYSHIGDTTWYPSHHPGRISSFCSGPSSWWELSGEKPICCNVKQIPGEYFRICPLALCPYWRRCRRSAVRIGDAAEHPHYPPKRYAQGIRFRRKEKSGMGFVAELGNGNDAGKDRSSSPPAEWRFFSAAHIHCRRQAE